MVQISVHFHYQKVINYNDTSYSKSTYWCNNCVRCIYLSQWNFHPRKFLSTKKLSPSAHNKWKGSFSIFSFFWKKIGEKEEQYLTCRCLYFLWRAAITSPSSVHAVITSSSSGKLSFSITRLWYLPATNGLKRHRQ